MTTYPSFPALGYLLLMLTSVYSQNASAQTALPDLTLSITIQSVDAGDIIGSGDDQNKNYSVKYTATIRNIGNAPSQRCLLRSMYFKIGSHLVYGQNEHIIAPLAANATRTITLTDSVYPPYPLTMPKRDHRTPITGYFTINAGTHDEEPIPDGYPIPESNTNNNKVTMPIKGIKADN